MPLNYKIEGADGNEMSMAADQVVNDYQNAGYQNVSLSQDGQTFTATDPKTGQPMDANLSDLIAAQYGKVKSSVPQNVDYNGVNKSWRAAIEALPNDASVRKAYLQTKMDGLGFKDRKIIGDGEDFYSFNPETGKYSALTNSPGLDMSDVAGFLPSAARMVGAIGGGALGGTAAAAAGSVVPVAGTVAGGIAGAATGAAAGGALADEGMRKVAGFFDSDFKNTMNNMSEEQQSGNRREQAGRALLDGGTGGFSRIPGVAKALNKMAPTSWFARGAGKAADVGGRIAGGAGKFVAENDLARGVATTMTPGLGQAQQAGLIMRAGELPGLINKGVQKVAQRFAPKSGVAEAAGEFMKPRAVPYTGVDKFASKATKFMQGGAEEAGQAIVPAKAGVKDTITNMFSKTGSKLDERAFANSGNVTGYQDILENLGKNAGGGLQNMSTVGKGIEKGADNIMKYTAKGVQKSGEGVAKAGRGLNKLGRVAQPFEGRVILNRGVPQMAEEAQDAIPKVKRYFKPTQYQY